MTEDPEDHLEKPAYIYIRQSTRRRCANHQEARSASMPS